MTATLWFAITYASPCVDLPKFGPNGNRLGLDRIESGEFRYRDGGRMYEQLWCQPGQYSFYGSVFFTPLANGLARMFADPARQVRSKECGGFMEMVP